MKTAFGVATALAVITALLGALAGSNLGESDLLNPAKAQRHRVDAEIKAAEAQINLEKQREVVRAQTQAEIEIVEAQAAAEIDKIRAEVENHRRTLELQRRAAYEREIRQQQTVDFVVRVGVIAVAVLIIGAGITAVDRGVASFGGRATPAAQGANAAQQMAPTGSNGSGNGSDTRQRKMPVPARQGRGNGNGHSNGRSNGGR